MVLVLVALVAVTVIVAWSGLVAKAARESAITRLEFLDGHLRSYARKHGEPCSLSLKLHTSHVRKHYHDQEKLNPAWETLGRGVRIGEVRTTDPQKQSRQIGITYRRDGTSPTYGIQLTGPGKAETWLLFAGVSGQVTRLETEREFDAALELVSTRTRL